jgi:hypothetical protein
MAALVRPCTSAKILHKKLRVNIDFHHTEVVFLVPCVRLTHYLISSGGAHLAVVRVPFFSPSAGSLLWPVGVLSSVHYQICI